MQYIKYINCFQKILLLKYKMNSDIISVNSSNYTIQKITGYSYLDYPYKISPIGYSIGREFFLLLYIKLQKCD